MNPYLSIEPITLFHSETKRKSKKLEDHLSSPLQTFSKSDRRMKKLETPERIRNALACQIGTEHYWKVFPDDNAFKITDGVKTMAEMCEAFWLVADILACQQKVRVKGESFQVWTLTLNLESCASNALLLAEDGNGSKLTHHEIPYTDFPMREGITLFLDKGVLMLPSEY